MTSGRGIRTMGFERRATIVFRVKAREVVIVRIFYGGRDYEHGLRSREEPSE
jgi:toxin ParE1/3/4